MILSLFLWPIESDYANGGLLFAVPGAKKISRCGMTESWVKLSTAAEPLDAPARRDFHRRILGEARALDS